MPLILRLNRKGSTNKGFKQGHFSSFIHLRKFYSASITIQMVIINVIRLMVPLYAVKLILAIPIDQPSDLPVMKDNHLPQDH